MANESRDIDAFTRLLDTVKIEVSQSSDGIFTACTTSEPLFCYDADTKEELHVLVTDTLRSYAKHFFNIEGLEIGAEEAPILDGSILIERGTPVARLKPTFDLAA